MHRPYRRLTAALCGSLMDRELQVIAHHDIRPGAEDEVLALLPRLIEATRAEPGCISFDVVD